jgi:hypothetical protein
MYQPWPSHSRNDKLPEPLTHRGIRPAQPTDANGVDLSCDDPRETVGAKGPKDRVEHDERGGSGTAASCRLGDDGRRGRVADFDVDTDVEEAGGTGDGGEHPRLTTTPHVDLRGSVVLSSLGRGRQR